MPVKCAACGKKALLKRPKTGDAMCRECFYYAFEEEIHKTITDANLFIPGDRVAVGASGGKDSTVLAHVLKTLNERYNYGLDMVLLSVDEGITGYRDDSLETVKRNKIQYDLPLKIISYEELYGWTMDAIVKEIGLKNNCTFCGVFRRQALDRGAMLLKCNKIVTGHNADDIAETVIMNVLRGDVARLRRCTAITTGLEGALPRCKPFKYTYEKEIVMYAYFKKLDYFSTECIYSPNAYRGYARAYIKDAEKIRASSIMDIIHSGESISIKTEVKMPVQGNCTRCGYVSSQDICKACLLLEGLNKGLPKLGIGKTRKVRKLAKISQEGTSTASTSSTAGADTACTGGSSPRHQKMVFAPIAPKVNCSTSWGGVENMNYVKNIEDQMCARDIEDQTCARDIEDQPCARDIEDQLSARDIEDQTCIEEIVGCSGSCDCYAAKNSIKTEACEDSFIDCLKDLEL